MASFSTAKIGPLLVGDRPLPQCIEAEKAILSCLLLDPCATMDSVFSRIKTETCFHHAPHRKIFLGLREMRNEMVPDRIDLITVTTKFERSAVLEDIGGEEYLNHLYNVVPTTANVDKYVDHVLDAYILRTLIATCSDIVGRCFEATGEVPEFIDSVERKIMDVTEIRTDTYTKTIKDLMKDAVDYLQALSEKRPEAIGLATGFKNIDRKITGMKPGELIVLAARPSMGKTALALDITRHVSVDKKIPVGIFSLEMGSHQVIIRMLSSEGQINMKDIRDGTLSNAQWSTKVMGTADRLSAAPIYIDDTPQLSSLELRHKARRMKLEYNIQLIVIDYLQLMRPVGVNKTTSREQEVAKLSADIKALAKELNLPILLLCQLNRQAEQGNQPKLSQLRESGAIEQDADIVMLLHRGGEGGEEKETHGSDGDDTRIKSQVIVAKNRNGETGIADLAFKPEWTRFFDQAPQYVSDADVPVEASY